MIRRSLESLYEGLLSLIYPRLCVVCGEALQSGEIALCLACASELPLCTPYRPTGEERLWASPLMGGLYSVYTYQRGSLSQKLLYGYKYRHQLSVARLALERAKALYPELERGSYDYILAIPLGRKRLHERGYNQALVWAEELAGWLGGKASDHYILRVGSEQAQKGRQSLARRLASRDLFAPNPKQSLPWHSARILVVDDILTTGATLGAYLDTLEGLGVRRVDVFTMAITI